MIRTEIQIVVLCDHCEAGLTGDADNPAGVPAVFADRVSALAALDTAATVHGWARRLGGRLLCPPCADRAWCLIHGHDYRDHGAEYAEDGPHGWRVCGCDRTIPGHLDAVDPAGGPGCGMVWRLCGRCDHIDERHATEHGAAGAVAVARAVEGVLHQPGGSFRQVVPAGLADPHHPTCAVQDAREDGRPGVGQGGGCAAIVGAKAGGCSR